MRTWTMAAMLVACLAAGGCPRDAEVPQPAGDARSCASRADCNDATCGTLRACVDGLCESDRSLQIPCLDGG